MKKITKLINGSIVVFVICLIAVLTLTSCDNTNGNDNLRKGQDTNITEVQGDEYQVTKEEFEKAINFTAIEHYTLNAEFYLKEYEAEEPILTSKLYAERKENILEVNFYNDKGEISQSKTFNACEYNPIKQIDYKFEDFTYIKETKSYNAKIGDYMCEFYFKNKKLYRTNVSFTSIIDDNYAYCNIEY